jgi:hypothetical protein
LGVRSVGADAWLDKCDAAGYRLSKVIEETVARMAQPVSARRFLPTEIAALLNDVLNASAQEQDAHAERSFRLALLALEIARPNSDPAWRTACADAIGISLELLRQYAFAASRWSQGDLRELLHRGLSMSHLKEIATLPREARCRWVGICLERHFTILELRDAMRAEVRPAAPTDLSKLARKGRHQS